MAVGAAAQDHGLPLSVSPPASAVTLGRSRRSRDDAERHLTRRWSCRSAASRDRDPATGSARPAPHRGLRPSPTAVRSRSAARIMARSGLRFAVGQILGVGARISICWRGSPTPCRRARGLSAPSRRAPATRAAAWRAPDVAMVAAIRPIPRWFQRRGHCRLLMLVRRLHAFYHVHAGLLTCHGRADRSLGGV